MANGIDQDRISTDVHESGPEAQQGDPTGFEPGFGARLKTAVGSARISVLSAQVGITPSYFYAMLRDARRPSVGSLLAIAQLTGVSLDWLLTGRGSQFREFSGRTLLVPCHRIASDGTLTATGDHEVVSARAARGMDIKHAASVEAPDDGLAPLIEIGDMLLIEAPPSGIVDRGVYLARVEGKVEVRRAEPARDGWWVLSRGNPARETRPVIGRAPDDLGIVARVWTILQRPV